MNSNHKKLELDKILSQLAEYAVSDGCRERVTNTLPLTNADDVRAELAKTDDAFTLSSKYGSPRFDRIRDVRASAARANSGSSLSLRELLDIGVLLREVSQLRSWYSQCSGSESTLADYFSGLIPNKALEDSINNAILSEEELSDSASPELSRIRKAIFRQGEVIRETLNKLVKSREKFLRDSIVTQRDGRYVIPVKTEYKGEVPGLLHDTSGSGQTLFIEPMSVVEANNEIRMLKGREQTEIERIVAELSAAAGDFAQALAYGYENALEIEYRFVKANFAAKLKCSSPAIAAEPVINLRLARHPLISADDVVPISIELGGKYQCLIITGPNTGGKTVALKTAGLLTLMAQCGLMIPAGDGSVVHVFDRILVDIGDEQSIEQSLSTFSSHMSNIVGILDNAGENTLVLLDELGSGTDPVEGASLAVAILERLKANGAFVMATTHYQEVKLFAIDTDGVENASCEFDVATLRPTFRLIVGLPGKSNAFAIAKRLGFDDGIIASASEMVSGENRRFEQIVESLEQSRQELEQVKSEAVENRRKSEKITAELEKRLEQTRNLSEREAQNARNKANGIINEVRFTADRLLDELEQLKHDKDKEDFSARVRGARGRIDKELDRAFDAANPVEERAAIKAAENYQPPRPFKKYDEVLLIDIGKKGVLQTSPDKSGNCLVQVGVMRTKTNTGNLQLCEREQVKIDGKDVTIFTQKSESAMTRSISMELDLRGMAADEARDAVDKYLDESIMAGLHQVTIIHGKGTGVLRTAVQNLLKHHRHVESYRPGVYGEGEAGVTVAVLK